VVRLLLERGADVNGQGRLYNNALYVASEGGHEAVVRQLSKHGANVNAQGGLYGNALSVAVARGHKVVVRLFRNAGATNVWNVKSDAAATRQRIEEQG
jgi:ankyrin repeat protein